MGTKAEPYNNSCDHCRAQLRAVRRSGSDNVRAIGIAKGWVVARKHRRRPFVISWRDWLALPQI